MYNARYVAIVSAASSFVTGFRLFHLILKDLLPVLFSRFRYWIKESGVSDYSIFWDKDTNILFAVQKTSGEGGSQDLGDNPIVQKWWAYMADIMETAPVRTRCCTPVSGPDGSADSA